MLNLKQEREEKGWSQAALARKANLNATTICSIENSRMIPYPSQAQKIATALEWEGDTAALFEEVHTNDTASS